MHCPGLKDPHPNYPGGSSSDCGYAPSIGACELEFASSCMYVGSNQMSKSSEPLCSQMPHLTWPFIHSQGLTLGCRFGFVLPAGLLGRDWRGRASKTLLLRLPKHFQSAAMPGFASVVEGTAPCLIHLALDRHEKGLQQHKKHKNPVWSWPALGPRRGTKGMRTKRCSRPTLPSAVPSTLCVPHAQPARQPNATFLRPECSETLKVLTCLSCQPYFSTAVTAAASTGCIVPVSSE